MRGRRSFGLFAAVGAIAVVASTSLAFACTASRYIEIGALSGPVGSTETVTVSGFNPASNPTYGPVEIRWNTTDGELLGSAPGPSFSVDVRIPDARPANYFIAAVQRTVADGKVAYKATATFEITGSTAAPAPPAATTAAPETASVPTPGPASSPSPAPTTAADPSPTPVVAASSATAAASPAAAAPATLQPQGGVSAQTHASSASSARRSVTPSATSSLPAPTWTSAARPETPAASEGEADTAPSANRATSQDQVPASHAPSLLSSPVDGETGSSFAAGMVFFAVGLMTLFAGLCVTQARRRRVRATTRD